MLGVEVSDETSTSPLAFARLFGVGFMNVMFGGRDKFRKNIKQVLRLPPSMASFLNFSSNP